MKRRSCKKLAALTAVVGALAAAPTATADPGEIQLPPNPVHGATVSFAARTLPPNPVHGSLVSRIARRLDLPPIFTD